MSKPDKIEKDHAGSKIALLPPAGTYAKQKQEFRAFVLELKRLAIQQRYTRRELASELGVSSFTITQWLKGHTPMARPEHVERSKKFLSANRSG
jgi:DNA-binding XRE family transcriptional regulator